MKTKIEVGDLVSEVTGKVVWLQVITSIDGNESEGYIMDNDKSRFGVFEKNRDFCPILINLDDCTIIEKKHIEVV